MIANARTVRRALLAASLLIGPCGAQAAQRIVQELCGAVTASNYGTLQHFMARNLDKVVRLKISVRRTDEQAPARLRADADDDGRLAIFLESTPAEPSESEIVLAKGHTLNQGDYVIDGAFVVKGGGVHQGIVSYGLQPSEAARSSRAMRVKTFDLAR